MHTHTHAHIHNVHTHVCTYNMHVQAHRSRRRGRDALKMMVTLVRRQRTSLVQSARGCPDCTCVRSRVKPVHWALGARESQAGSAEHAPLLPWPSPALFESTMNPKSRHIRHNGAPRLSRPSQRPVSTWVLVSIFSRLLKLHVPPKALGRWFLPAFCLVSTPVSTPSPRGRMPNRDGP